MKKLVCEMCGSADLIKQDGLFVCQCCGLKYTVEEARKMMVEGSVEVVGTVDVQGTVKVDNAELVEKYLSNARRAKAKEDWEETEKYYNMVEQNDPDNIEAIFYSAYGKAKASLTENDIYKRQAVFKALTNCVSIIDDNYNNEDPEQLNIVTQISDDIINMACSSYVYTETKNGYGVVTKTNKYETVTLFNTLGLTFVDSLGNMANGYGAGHNEEKAQIFKLAIRHLDFVLENGNLANPMAVAKFKKDYQQKLKAVDPTFQANERTLNVVYRMKAGGAGQLWFSIDGGDKIILYNGGNSIYNLEGAEHTIKILNPLMKRKEFEITVPESGMQVEIIGGAFGMKLGDCTKL